MAGDISQSPTQVALPTLDRLKATVPTNANVKDVASEWFRVFNERVEAADPAGVAALFLKDGFWRDMLALTWDFRTLCGTERISKFIADVFPNAGFSKLALKVDSVTLQKPYPDLEWVQGFFEFETSVGHGTGVFRLVPAASGRWKAHIMFTNLEELKGFPERVGWNRDFEPIHGKWPEKRRREINFEDGGPVVIIVGGGQSGLEVAARLKLLDVPTLVVEKQARIGDQWRLRYEALCLHDLVWYDQMPYIPCVHGYYSHPCSEADWLESYAHSLELNVWTSAAATKLIQDPSGKGWEIEITRGDGSIRTFKPRHVVLAHGTGGGVPKMPDLPGTAEFQGKLIHSSQHKSARDHIEMKVIVIGAGTSGHDLANDHATYGVDVTMYQRSPTYVMSVKDGGRILFGGRFWEGCPPTEVVDRTDAATPNHVAKLLGIRVTEAISKVDNDLLEGLRKVGFKLTFGDQGSGNGHLWLSRGGGYYLDVGASQSIIDGKIKLKNDSHIASISKHGVVFDDGTELPADILICTTGFGDPRDLLKQLAGEEVAAKVPRIWGLSDEGELNTVYRWCGLPGLYFMMGNLALCRFHSRHVALQIKAHEVGSFGKRYSA